MTEAGAKQFWRGYFQEALRGDVNDKLLGLMQEEGHTIESLAAKLGWRPKFLRLLLSAPNNIGLDTVSDLAFAMGYAPTISFAKFDATAIRQGEKPG